MSRTRFTVLCVGALLLPAACGGESESTGAAAPPAPSGWIRHQDPRGFALNTPKGWTVEVAGEALVTARSPDKARMVLVAPFVDREGDSAMAWLAREKRTLGGVLPGAEIQRTRQLRTQPDELLATLSYKAGGTEGRADLLCVHQGPTVMLYGVAAPKPEFDRARGELLKVLRSFVFTQPEGGGGGKPPAPRIEYVKAADKKEGAFTVEVPKGWERHVALERLSALDPRPVIRLTSPDGKVLIGAGDAELLPFVLPDPMLASTGFTEGSTYSPGYGVVMRVMSYHPGARFAREYVALRLGEQAPDLRFTSVRQRPDLAARINAIHRQQSPGGMMNFEQHYGEVTFTCTLEGKPRVGYTFAGTRVLRAQGASGNWQFTDLYGYAATPDAVPVAESVLAHMVATFSLNPEWVAMQQGLTANVSRIVRKTGQEISDMLRKSYEQRQAAQDDTYRKVSNAIRGQTDVKDPETGESWKVEYGHNYYWRREGTNELTGTRTAEPPDIDFAPLEEW